MSLMSGLEDPLWERAGSGRRSDESGVTDTAFLKRTSSLRRTRHHWPARFAQWVQA
jgi:hypothetical protein